MKFKFPKKMIIFRYKKIDFYLLLLLFLSIFAIIDIRLRLVEIPELFHGASVFETDIYNISIAYIASFIFYVLIEFIPQYLKRKKFAFYINRQIKEIFDVSADVVDAIVVNSSLNKSNYLPSNAELENMLEEVGTGNSSNRGKITQQGIIYDSVWQVIMECPPRVLYSIDRLSLRTPDFDEDLDALLMEIEECKFFIVLRQLGVNFEYNNITILSGAFNDYLDLLNKLSDYSNLKYGSVKFEKMFSCNGRT